MNLSYPIRSDKFSFQVSVKGRLWERQSDFQRIEFIDTDAFGKMLLLDGHVQLAELDEHVYHECLVHIPMLNIPTPKRALIVGGGDGAVLRELLKWPLQRVDMVEIDAAVIEGSRAAWPELSAGSFDDASANVNIADAFEFVKSASESYDLIVMDSTDVYEEEDGGLSEMLFTEAFYRDLKRLLSPAGFVITQADNLVFCPYSLKAIQGEFDKVFERTGAYSAVIPSFGGFSGYCWASRGATLAEGWPEGGQIPAGCRYLTPLRYRAAFDALPFAAP